jgi:DNA mismatch repair protein MutL
MTRIHVLERQVADRIAAGEVVERPASVVKELIENSLDAGTTAISVEVRDGGLSLIRVSDDGTGMSRADVPLALERFATSKITSLDDLTAIRTLGFRGEALPSIAAVAEVEILTRTRDELEGTRLCVAAGQTVIEPAASPVGTGVTVRGLFATVPARRKFLKSPLRESELVRQTVSRYALANPAVAFRLVINGRESLALPPASPLERAGAVFGRDVAAELIPIRWEAADLRVWGFVSRPTIGRSNRQAQSFFVNARPVRAGLLAVMLERPYAGRLAPGRYPVAVVFVELDPRWVDVNVHPRKAEVRFAQERAVYQALSQAVETALAPFPVTEPGWAGFAWPFAGEPLDGTLREPGATYQAGELRAIGQVHRTYVLAQVADGLAVVDQHAAHEQVLFERLLHGESRPVEPALRVGLTRREVGLVERCAPALASLGLAVEPFGDGALVRGMPAPLAGVTPAELVTALLAEAEHWPAAGEDEMGERLAMKAACLAAIKAGDLLSPEQQQALLDDLAATWSPATCPHGRPAVITLTLEELERRFLRR